MSEYASARSSFVQSILDIMPRLECRRIKHADDLSEVFKLRYKAYLANDLIEPNNNGMSIDSYDLLDNCQIFGIYSDDHLISSIRIHHVTADRPSSPAFASFRDVIAPELNTGNSFIDGSRFCVDPDRTAELSIMPFLTVRIAYMASVHLGSTYNISVIRREHSAFYKRYYGFERWAGDRMLDWYKLPVDLYVGDMRKNQAKIDERLPFMKSSFEERLILFSDEMPHQGVSSVMGMFGNMSTNSIVGGHERDLQNYTRIAVAE